MTSESKTKNYYNDLSLEEKSNLIGLTQEEVLPLINENMKNGSTVKAFGYLEYVVDKFKNHRLRLCLADHYLESFRTGLGGHFDKNFLNRSQYHLELWRSNEKSDLHEYKDEEDRNNFQELAKKLQGRFKEYKIKSGNDESDLSYSCRILSSTSMSNVDDKCRS